MATDPATASDPQAILKRTYSAVAIDLGSTRTGVVVVRGDIAEYFKIAIDQAAGTGGMVRRTRKAHTRSKYNAGLGDTTVEQIQVSASEWFEPPDGGAKIAGGRRIQVPTELKSPKGIIRVVTMHFPYAATNAVISAWLHEKCTAHKPKEFKTESGKTLLVVSKGAIPDLNPGNKTPSATPAA